MTFNNRLISLVLFSVLFFACNSAAEFKEDSLLNKWQMEKFILDGKDRSQQFNPKGDRSIIFQIDGNFKEKSEFFPENNGTFIIDGNSLKMVGNAKPGEVQEITKWTFDIKGRNLILKKQQEGSDISTEIHYKGM